MEPSPPRLAAPSGAGLSRRLVLRGTALAPVIAAAVTGCTGAQPEEPDPLEPLAESARSDARMADAVAGTHPGLASRAAAVASARREHARTLQQEIDRRNPPDPESPKTPASRAPASPPPSSGAAEAELRGRLREAQGQAARFVPSAQRYRAGLCGSVSAGCASLLEVFA